MIASAHVFQINRSAGGVPKRPVAEASIGPLGVEGDRQHNTRYHGGPERALCLYSLELILALQREGHPIFPGAVGENVTIAGLDWGFIQPGIVVNLGLNVRVEVTQFASPCQTIAGAFHEGEMRRIADQLHPGWARAYARVRVGGLLRIGDSVSLIP